MSEIVVDHNNESSGETRSAMHTWRYRHHFAYKADQGKNIIVQCNLCLPRVNLLSTSKTSTSNLKKHLDRTHLGCEARPDVKRGRKKEEHNVQTTVTDNGSPFISVFKEFAVDSQESDDDIGFYENVSTVLEGEPEQDMLLFLPTVQRCASHTLELIVTEDFWQAVSQGPMCQLHYSSMAKVFAIWSKCHHLQVGMDAAEEIGKMALVVPAVIRWNVEYCAVQKIVSLTERELTELCARLEVPRMQQEEMAFLKEYVTVFHPLAFALELFQAEQKCYLGLVIPTVLSLKNKLNEQKDAANYLGDVINAIVVAIDVRFQELFSSTEAKIATATTPQFRLWWMAASDREEMCSLLATEASQIDPCYLTEAIPSRNLSTIESEDDFFSYGSPKPTVQIQQRGVMDEICKYVEGTGKSLGCLQDFPRIKQLFLKYNTTLPSTAPVQRLFSQKGNLVTSQRNLLTDDYFERLQLLRYNINVLTMVTQ
ncbi:hypothetical protein FQN60_003724 [Etheostoma spectabile]|uniref:BED-type domain-containing protein n=1 Tax=Etheostoma spectabile TaxID=54343 RepID=A0A5J5CWR8_9PERO|nr:hypothetical protein FQN60_003724 [Etheostoma spectabile]